MKALVSPASRANRAVRLYFATESDNRPAALSASLSLRVALSTSFCRPGSARAGKVAGCIILGPNERAGKAPTFHSSGAPKATACNQAVRDRRVPQLGLFEGKMRVVGK